MSDVASAQPRVPELYLDFHGRVIDHLGIQMYQSPMAAVAELVSNSWDADAESVQVLLPDRLTSDAEIVVKDDGDGMTFSDCQRRFLNVGYNRRGGNPVEKTKKSRTTLGRKGIGKFAGFGIARVIRITTVSAENGEATSFELDLDDLRGTDEAYVATGRRPIKVIDYSPPDPARRSAHGTTLRLSRLKLTRAPSQSVFSRGLALRFLLQQMAADFAVSVNDDPLPQEIEAGTIQFDFPGDYSDSEIPEGVTVEDSWGREVIAEGQEIRWRIRFCEAPVGDEDLTGVAVFVNGKMAQTPFAFQLSGGIGAQHGQAYMSGRVEAGFLDAFDVDLIATERQRIDWEAAETQPLLEWGKTRVQSLLRLWQERRSQEKLEALGARLAPFSERLAHLPRHERQVVDRALRNIAKVESITTLQFVQLGEAVVTAWETGRLRLLIHRLSEAEDMAEAQLLEILNEADVLTALHTAEAVRAKVEVVEGLRERIERRELELGVRNFIATNPWLMGPRWETHSVEKRVDHILRDAADRAGLDSQPDWRGRVDLVLSASDSLLVLEFMRPGVNLDYDHLDRFNRYVLRIRTQCEANTGLNLNRVSGVLVADGLGATPEFLARLQQLRADDCTAFDWQSLLAEAESQWREFLGVLKMRSPTDRRLREITEQPADQLAEETSDSQE